MLNGVMLRHTGGKSRFRAVHVPFQDPPWVNNATYTDGVFTLVHGSVTDTVRIDGDRVTVSSSAGWQYDSGTPTSGVVTAVERDADPFAFRTEKPAPAARWVRINYGRKRRMIYRLEAVEGRRMLLTDDPGFSYDPDTQEARFLYHPHETLDGPLSWTVWR